MQITEQIKNKLNIIDVIQEYIPLKKVGASFKALCPFHQEKTPSFIVSEEKQIWHCFGCNLGGDVFGFIKQYEGLEFPEVLRILAKKAGIQLERQNPAWQNRRTKILDILKLAAEFYHQTLLKSQIAQTARQYLKNRQLAELTIDEFKIGYAAPGWQTVSDFLKKRGYKDQEILESGLAVSKISSPNQVSLKSGLTYYDRFRERIMFPIWDIYGNIIGFGARTMSVEQKIAKYINTSDTLVYHKSEVLYAMHKAKQAIRQENLAVIVEGYMDVISSHQAGIKNVVAVSGTALTLEQLNLLKRHTNNIVLAFDFDEAGIQAALRSYELALELGLNIKIVQLFQQLQHLPASSLKERQESDIHKSINKIDPDDLIKKDPQLWQKAIKNAVDIMDYYFYVTLKDLDLNNLTDKRKAASILLKAIAKIGEPVSESHYLEKLASLIKVAEADLRLVLEKYRAKISKNSTSRQIPERPNITMRSKYSSINGISLPALEQTIKTSLYNDFLLEYLLALILKFKSQPSSFARLNLEAEPALFKDQELFALYKVLKETYNNQQELADIPQRFKNLILKLELLAGKEFSSLNVDEAQKEIERLLENLNKNILRSQIQKLTFQLKILENGGQQAEALELSRQIQELNKKIN